MRGYIKHIKTGFYLCELRGVVFVTWVAPTDKAHAISFALYEEDRAQRFADLVSLGFREPCIVEWSF